MRVRNLTNRLHKIFASNISKRFTFRVVSLTFLLALVLSLFIVFRSYQEDIETLKKDLDQIEQSIKNSLSYNLWIMNLDGLNILGKDLLLSKFIIYVAIYDEKGTLLLKKGQKRSKHTIKRIVPVFYQTNGQRIYVGKLIYYVTTQPIFDQLKESALRAFITIFVFFLFMSFVIVVIYWDSTVRYLLSIRDYAQKLRVGGYKERGLSDLNLDRKTYEKDELEQLVDTINEMRKEIVKNYEKLEYQSLHDALTGLPNRRWIKKKLEEIIGYCKKFLCYSVIFYIDLDQFKLINDSLGHTTGDRILLEISSRLKSLCGEMCVPTRISGDEFLIVCNKRFSDRKKAKKMSYRFARKVLEKICEPILIDREVIKMTASIGIAILGPESETEILVKQADNALYHAKERGRNQVAIFEPSMQVATDRRLEIEQLIDIAMQKDLFFIQYQPKYDAQKRVCSAEALVRLRDEKGNIVSPGEFIPIAEESGLIIKIGDIVLQKVFAFVQQNKEILEKSIQNIAINVSPTQYSSIDFVDSVINFARQYEIDPNFIILEITEEVMAGSIDNVLDVMMKLKKEGFKFSIDDFGTGYSSLQYIKNFPLDELKIDKSFIDDVLVDKKVEAVVKTIIDMAHNLDLFVTTEGVETEDQFELVRHFGCDMYQGFLFSKPLNEEEFLRQLQ